MSIIKGKTNIVAGFGGTKRNIGEVYFSQSSLATDNSGALPGWTGDYYENGKTLFPDLYNFVKAHSELQVTKTEYDNAIATYDECPKYVVDENGGTNVQSVTRYVWTDTASNTGGLITKTRNPQVGDPVWYWNEQSIKKVTDFDTVLSDNVITNISSGSITATVDTTNGASIPELTDITATFTEEQANKGTITVTTAGTSLRLPKYANYIKMAGIEGITQSKAGLPTVKAISNTAAGNVSDLASLPSYAKPVQNTKAYSLLAGSSIQQVTTWCYVENDASLDSAVYGASDTVTPAHTTLYPWITAYTSAIPASVAQAAEFTNALTGKANTDLSNVLANIDYVVDRKVPTASDPSWYEVWKSGKVRQGGSLSYSAVRQKWEQITLLKPMQDLNYNITITPLSTYRSDTTAYAIMSSVGNKTTTSFLADCYGVSDVDTSVGFTWSAEGQGAN